MTSKFQRLLALCKRRAILFPAFEQYGGLRGAYDYGPYGTVLKSNIVSRWLDDIVHSRNDVVQVDTGLMAPQAVFKASGHEQNFKDEWVDDLLDKSRYRPDKADPIETLEIDDLNGKAIAAFRRAGMEIKDPTHVNKNLILIPINSANKNKAQEWQEIIEGRLAEDAFVVRDGSTLYLIATRIMEPAESGYGSIYLLKKDMKSTVKVPYRGFATPKSNSPFTTSPRSFNLMFKTFLDPIDPINRIIDLSRSAPSNVNNDKIRGRVDQEFANSALYLRPETAQGVFLAFKHIQHSMGLNPPFGIAQIGKAFRNEIRVEHALFRTFEFEQMELEFFTPATSKGGTRWESRDWFEYWTRERMNWWKTYLNNKESVRLAAYQEESPDLAHYAHQGADIEFNFSFGWGEIEGIANRTSYDLEQHNKACGANFLVKEEDKNKLYTPHVVECSAGLSRAVLAVLSDAYEEIEYDANKEDNGPTSQQLSTTRAVLRLHPLLAPIKVAVLPVVSNKLGLNNVCREVTTILKRARIPCVLDDQNAKIGKRYYKHDEVGTPWCVTVDHQTFEDRTVTVRDRDTTKQIRIRIEELATYINEQLNSHLPPITCLPPIERKFY
ncbi:glycyl-tRNA synthetase [Ramicandelaber brevisporus]|nr:glycyl-tRNA synthetase [Ramicandelaber brevisporus]